MSALVYGIHHVSLKATNEQDFLRALSFWRDTLGLSVVRTWGESASSGAMLQIGESIIELSASGTPVPDDGAIRHIALKTENVDACLKAVRDAGYPVTMEARDLEIASDPTFPIRIGFVRGPLGEEIEFFTER